MKYTLSVVAAMVLLASCGGSSTSTNDNSLSGSGAAYPDSYLDMNANTNGSLEGSALEERKQLENDLATAKQLLAEAQEMDITKSQDDIKARITAVKEKATSLREVDDFFVEADSLLQDAQTLEDRVANYVQVAALPLHEDLSGKFQDISIKSLMKQGGNIFAVAEKGVYGPINSGKVEDVKAITLPEGSIGTSGTYSIKYRESYITSLPGQMWKIAGDALTPQKVEEGGAWYPGSEIWTYSKFIYILDPLSKQLWKYEYISENLFKKPIIAIDTPEMKALDIKSVSIDGNIYVLGNGTITKFTQGKKIDLEIGADLKNLSSSSTIYTDQNSTYLYAFDPTAGRLIRFKKRATGLDVANEYTIQGSYKGMIVSPDEKSVFFFDTNKIYKLAL
ncbi:MAG: hypothetical protein ACK4NC_03935 [Candidatus Gracilibacteria bacterium]